MKRIFPLAFALPLSALALSACSGSEQADEPAKPPQMTLNEVMRNEIDLRADAVWEIGNAAIDDQAGLDPAKMTNAKWNELAQHATSLQQGAIHLATLNPIIVVKQGERIADEGVPYGDSAVDVQAGIDRNPQGLRDMANGLASHMAELAIAARAHDGVKAGALISQIDGVCEDCHLSYWYPSQKELVDQFRDPRPETSNH